MANTFLPQDGAFSSFQEITVCETLLIIIVSWTFRHFIFTHFDTLFKLLFKYNFEFEEPSGVGAEEGKKGKGMIPRRLYGISVVIAWKEVNK